MIGNQVPAQKFTTFIHALKEITMTYPEIEPSDSTKEANNELVFSYLTLRNLIGFSGILLPIILAIAPRRPSDYYGF